MLDWALNVGLGFECWTGLWAWIGVVVRIRQRMWWRWCQRWQRCSSKNECFSFQGRNESSDEVQPQKHCFYTPHYRLFLHATLQTDFMFLHATITDCFYTPHYRLFLHATLQTEFMFLHATITDCFYTPHYKLVLCFYTPPLKTDFARHITGCFYTPHYIRPQRRYGRYIFLRNRN